MSMEAPTSERLAKIIHAHRQRTDAHSHEKPIDRERRLARETVLSEIPKLIARITRAVAELNDTLADDGIRVDMEIGDHQPTREGAYTLRVAGASDQAPTMSLGVDWAGVVRAMLQEGPKRSLLSTHTVFEMDKARITDLVLRLLEANYL
jgi:hypothetical protein